MTDGRRDDRVGWTAGGDLPVRVVALLALMTGGLALAGAGAALGLGDALGDGGETPELTVSGENLTVVTGGAESRTVMDMTDVRELQITVTDNEFRIQAERARPLSEDDRRRATAIVRRNETVMAMLGPFGDHEAAVRPARRDVVTDERQDSGTLRRAAGSSERSADGSLELYLAEDSDDSVTIRRQSTAQGQAVVVTVVTQAQRHPQVLDSTSLDRDDPVSREFVQYSLVVDLEGQQVVGLTVGPDD